MHLRKVLKPATLILAVVIAGCSSTVQEDRSINYSADGAGVAFQHGEDGVFVASGDGKELEKVYQAGEETIAVSSPLWSPVDKRLIFTTARPAESEGRVATELPDWNANPEGRQYTPEETVYTCLLRSERNAGESDADENPPVALFEASVDHPGYVAANLAVRWHPDGDRILFVDRTDGAQHSLFEFDIATKKRRQLLPFSAAALIFDWTPGGSYLVCVIAGGDVAEEQDGIWIRPANEEEWWRVPESDHLSMARPGAMLEQLRATRPVWTKDEQRFAFCASYELPDSETPSYRHVILTATPNAPEAKSLYESSAELLDLHWNPQSDSLGFIENTDPISLRFVDPSGAQSEAVRKVRARRFAGWNHNGSKLAFIVPEPLSDSSRWAWLFPAVPDARDRVHVASSGGDAPSEVVHSGVRITFPQWSPTDNTISLWGTYSPTHRSLLSSYLPWSLRPGDPAAILDFETGELTWMAINTHEQVQVGHYYMLRREFEEAWKWYERAAVGRKSPLPIKLSEIDQFLRQTRVHNDSTFFEYCCLIQLGRNEEAALRLDQFRTAMSFDLDGEALQEFGEQWQGSEEQLREELGKLVTFATPLIQSAYITEVFLSLDAGKDGITFFERELESAKTAPNRLAALLCLSQLLLIENEHDAYAELATSELAPLLLEMIEAPGDMSNIDFQDLPKLRRTIEDFTMLAAGQAALGPLASEEFLAGFSEEQLRRHLAEWRKLGERAENDAERLGVDSVLAALLQQLGDEGYLEIEARLNVNPFKEMVNFALGQ